MPLARDGDGWSWDGESLSETEVVERRDAQTEIWADELGLIAAEELGLELRQAIEFPVGRITAFATRFLMRAGEIVTAAYAFAAGGADRVTSGGWTTVADLVTRQTEYGRGFVEALRTGEISGAQAVARARLYAGAAVEAFERGRADQIGWEPPGMPGEGTACGSNCRCFWRVEELADRFEGTWVAHDDAGTCATCSSRASEWSPWVQEK
jgi:hypothetical protein